ncbi:hypothetical protein PG995_004505 [Apiospora arundinis]
MTNQHFQMPTSSNKSVSKMRAACCAANMLSLAFLNTYLAKKPFGDAGGGVTKPAIAKKPTGSAAVKQTRGAEKH